MGCDEAPCWLGGHGLPVRAVAFSHNSRGGCFPQPEKLDTSEQVRMGGQQGKDRPHRNVVRLAVLYCQMMMVTLHQKDMVDSITTPPTMPAVQKRAGRANQKEYRGQAKRNHIPLKRCLSHQSKPAVPEAMTQEFLKNTTARLQGKRDEWKQYQGKCMMIIIQQTRQTHLLLVLLLLLTLACFCSCFYNLGLDPITDVLPPFIHPQAMAT
jgi:hypothetical protein